MNRSKTLEKIIDRINGSEQTSIPFSQMEEDFIKVLIGSPGIEIHKDYYHYTNLRGLHGIFSNYIEAVPYDRANPTGYVRSCIFRASQIRFLNDKNEYLEGLSKYEEVLEWLKKQLEEFRCNRNINEYEKKLLYALVNREQGLLSGCEHKYRCEDIYSISFCSKGDLKSQWQLYGKDKDNNDECGISIRFDLDKVSFLNSKTNNDTCVRPFPVCYTESQKRELFIRCCTRFDTDCVWSIGLPEKDDYIPYCKSVFFEEEHESRLLFFNRNKGKMFSPYHINYINLKPTIDILFQIFPGHEKENIISEIIVGPGYNQNLTFNHIIHIFDKNSFVFYDDNIDLDDKEDVQIDIFKKEEIYYGQFRTVVCEYGHDNNVIKRVAYKCKNGVIVMKSSIPFRE